MIKDPSLNERMDTLRISDEVKEDFGPRIPLLSLIHDTLLQSRPKMRKRDE